MRFSVCKVSGAITPPAHTAIAIPATASDGFMQPLLHLLSIPPPPQYAWMHYEGLLLIQIALNYSQRKHAAESTVCLKCVVLFASLFIMSSFGRFSSPGDKQTMIH